MRRSNYLCGRKNCIVCGKSNTRDGTRKRMSKAITCSSVCSKVYGRIYMRIFSVFYKKSKRGKKKLQTLKH